ncbi:MAG TPA: hypothetical protein VNT30_22620 [Stellaceae bacterium]|nr:hypothetical protein [Stellaceae bacterium]
MSSLSLAIPDLAHLKILLATCLVALACIGLGALVGARRLSTALVAGWGFGCLVMVMLGTLTPLPLSVGLIGLAVVGVAGVARAGSRGEIAGLRTELPVIILALPILSLISAMDPSQYDEFSHWLPNLGHLFIHDHFPSSAAPNTVSDWPAYPYGLPLIGYAVSLLVGRLAESAGIVWNGLLLIAAGGVVVDLIGRHLASRSMDDGASDTRGRWTIAAIGVLLAILLNPGFVAKLAFTTYADSSVSAVLAVALSVIAGWFGASEGGGAKAGRRSIIVCGWCCAALVSLRQDAFVLFFLFAIGIVAAALIELWRGRAVRPAALFWMLPAPLATMLLWRHYAGAEMPAGDFSLLPFAAWHWAELPETLRTVATIALNKGGLFGLMLIVTLGALATVLRPRWFTPLQRAGLVIGAAIGAGNTAFLIVAYLAASFMAVEAAQATSFWRYSTHVGLPLVIAGICLPPARWWDGLRRSRVAGTILIVLALILPFATIRWLRIDVATHVPYLRATGHDIAMLTPDVPAITMVDLDGDSSNLISIRYQLLVAERVGNAAYRPQVTVISGQPDAATAKAILAAPEVWVFEGIPGAGDLFGLQLSPSVSYLLERQPDGFKVVRQWAFPNWTGKSAR